MQRNSNRNAIKLPSQNNIQQAFKSFDSSQVNGDYLEVPVSTKNLFSEVKRLRKENLELKRKNSDLTLKLKKLNELESK